MTINTPGCWRPASQCPFWLAGLIANTAAGPFLRLENAVEMRNAHTWLLACSETAAIRCGSPNSPPTEQVVTASAISASLASGFSFINCIAAAKASQGLHSPSSSLNSGGPTCGTVRQIRVRNGKDSTSSALHCRQKHVPGAALEVIRAIIGVELACGCHSAAPRSTAC